MEKVYVVTIGMTDDYDDYASPSAVFKTREAAQIYLDDFITSHSVDEEYFDKPFGYITEVTLYE